jgi:hypothetical protein
MLKNVGAESDVVIFITSLNGQTGIVSCILVSHADGDNHAYISLTKGYPIYANISLSIYIGV